MIFLRYTRRSLRASHRRREESADAHEQATTDFGKLGDEIGALDIDSSMPGASAQGKDEYAKAIDCYQDAERRLGKSGDDYQFERAVAAIRQGLEHVDRAGQLFNATHAGAPDGQHAATPSGQSGTGASLKDSTEGGGPGPP